MAPERSADIGVDWTPADGGKRGRPKRLGGEHFLMTCEQEESAAAS